MHPRQLTTAAAIFLVFAPAVTVVTAEPQLDEELRNASVDRIVDDRHVVDSALKVHWHAAKLPAAERYAYLLDWVFPSSDKTRVRCSVDFTPTLPPPVLEETRIRAATPANSVTHQALDVGAELVSPALDLIAVASELGKLDDLQKQLEDIQPAGEFQKRAQLASLALVNIAERDFAATQRTFDKLFPLIETNRDHSLAGRAPELLAIHAARQHAETATFATDAATHLLLRNLRISGRGPAEPWETHLPSFLADARRFQKLQPANDVVSPSNTSTPTNAGAGHPELREWRPASRWTAERRGRGAALAQWRSDGSRVENLSSHGEDFLYYHVPLRGNFEVHCDLHNRDYQNTQLVVCGNWAEPLFYSRDKYDFGNLRRTLGRSDVLPKLTKYFDTVHLRAVVEDRTVTFYTNGRLLHQVQLQDEPNPWIAIRSDARHDGSAFDIRITGQPTVPEELHLTASEDLSGWSSPFPHSVGKSPSTWEQMGDLANGGGILGRAMIEHAGMHSERLLQYHRPMFEDGTIQYEFFYQHGVAHVHPALDRLAMMLEPEGVQIHWVTDGPFERSDLSPNNRVDEPECRRGPRPLPIKHNEWNHAELSIAGDELTLSLNGQAIYQRPLEATNQRNFGFFYFADRSQARIRNVRWRGNWPRQLPTLDAQELANPIVHQLNARGSQLKAELHHDFKVGLPITQFAVEKSQSGTTNPTQDGVEVVQTGGSGYFAVNLALNAVIAGDFDVIAEYQGFRAQLSESSIGTAGLKINTSEADPQQCLLLRRLVRAPKQEDVQAWQAVLRNGPTEAKLDWKTLYSNAQESNDGTLWIARRGTRMYYLAAEAGSDSMRLLAESDVLAHPLPAKGIRLLTQISGPGHARVVWKNLRVRAESISHVPDTPPERTVWLINRDGTNLKRVLPEGTAIDGAGSPEFSPDGRLVAFDLYNGSTAKSRMYLVNANGSNLRDLGIGNMPSFSPDGKRIVFSSGPDGIVTMDLDGSNRTVIDAEGWGAQWSPDGRIAYSRAGNLLVYDPSNRSQRTVLEGDHATRYSSTYWNLGWSGDGKRLCFKGRTRSDGSFEIAVVSAAGSSREFRVLLSSEQEMVADFGWHPTDPTILCILRSGASSRLFLLRTDGIGQPELLSGQPTNHSVTGADWSPDGKQVLFTSITHTDRPAGS